MTIAELIDLLQEGAECCGLDARAHVERVEEGEHLTIEGIDTSQGGLVIVVDLVAP